MLRTYIPRRRWAASEAELDGMPTPRRNVYVHHSADAGPARWEEATIGEEVEYLRWMEASHREGRGFRAIAYSFVAMPSGRVYEGRGWAKAGTHTRGHNRDGHGICFAGNFMTQVPTDGALRAVRRLIRRGILRRKVARRPVLIGHRDVVENTVCPGDNLYARLAEIRP